MRFVALTCCALLMAGCATRPKTYQPPSDAKVKAAQADHTVKVVRVRETAKKAAAATAEAKLSADRLLALEKATASALEILREKLPPEYRPLLAPVQAAISAQAQEGETTRAQVNNAVGWNTQLAFQVSEAEKSRETLQSAQDDYAVVAAALAQDATTERNHRIAAEKQLSTQRWFGWLWKIGAGLLIALVGVFFVLKWLGKLGVVAAKIGIKAAL